VPNKRKGPGCWARAWRELEDFWRSFALGDPTFLGTAGRLSTEVIAARARVVRLAQLRLFRFRRESRFTRTHHQGQQHDAEFEKFHEVSSFPVYI
jgi:hypothetical protein